MGACVRVYLCACIHLCMCMYICVWACMYVCVCVCIRVQNLYVQLHAHTCIYICNIAIILIFIDRSHKYIWKCSHCYIADTKNYLPIRRCTRQCTVWGSYELPLPVTWHIHEHSDCSIRTQWSLNSWSICCGSHPFAPAVLLVSLAVYAKYVYSVWPNFCNLYIEFYCKALEYFFKMLFWAYSIYG